MAGKGYPSLKFIPYLLNLHGTAATAVFLVLPHRAICLGFLFVKSY